VKFSKRMAQRQHVLDAMTLAIEADDPEAIRFMLEALTSAGSESDRQQLLRAAVSIVSDAGLDVLDAAATEQSECTREVLREMAVADAGGVQ